MRMKIAALFVSEEPAPERGSSRVALVIWPNLKNRKSLTILSVWSNPEKNRYTMAAQELVMRARGVLRERGWRITNERLGSGDDITAFIIPLMYGNRQP